MDLWEAGKPIPHQHQSDSFKEAGNNIVIHPMKDSAKMIRNP